jgi:hypothetical protein
MKKFQDYIVSALHNIKRNKAYAAFYILGTAFTFIFISIILQLTNDIVNNTQPFIHADREVIIEPYSKNSKGYDVGNVQHDHVALFLSTLKEYEFCAIRGQQFGGVSINGRVTGTNFVTLVNGDYWNMREFDFIAGHSFTEEDVQSKNKVAVIRKSFAKANFKTNEVVGQRVEFQDIDYTIIGVVDDYNNFVNGVEEVWIPHTFNQFQPENNLFYQLSILPKEGVAITEFKERVVRALKLYHQNRAVKSDMDSDEVLTRKETRIKTFGNNKLSYGIPLVLLLLLVVPSTNIVVISIANVNNRAGEIAVRRSMGATVYASFIQMMTENLLLVLVGSILGVVLAIPMAYLISSYFLSSGADGYVSLISGIDFSILMLEILPLALLFALFSGGLSAYIVAKGNISVMLKGGSKC